MTETTQTLLLAAAMLAAVYAALPVVVKPKFQKLYRINGTNGLFKIHINHKAPRKYAVVAHEVAEWRYKYKRPWLWFEWFRTDSAVRKINLWGPAVETAYAVSEYGSDESQRIQAEARAIKASKAKRSYFGDDWPQERIEREITRRMPEARDWVDDNLDKIKEIRP